MLSIFIQIGLSAQNLNFAPLGGHALGFPPPLISYNHNGPAAAPLPGHPPAAASDPRSYHNSNPYPSGMGSPGAVTARLMGRLPLSDPLAHLISSTADPSTLPSPSQTLSSAGGGSDSGVGAPWPSPASERDPFAAFHSPGHPPTQALTHASGSGTNPSLFSSPYGHANSMAHPAPAVGSVGGGLRLGAHPSGCPAPSVPPPRPTHHVLFPVSHAPQPRTDLLPPIPPVAPTPPADNLSQPAGIKLAHSGGGAEGAVLEVAGGKDWSAGSERPSANPSNPSRSRKSSR